MENVDIKTAIEYMKANPYKNVLVRILNGRKYTYDQDGTPRINGINGMWVTTGEDFKDNEKWRLPRIY